MKSTFAWLVVCGLLTVSLKVVNAEAMTMTMTSTTDMITKFKNRSTVDDWLLTFSVETEHYNICKAQLLSCCFESGQKIQATKTTVNSKTVITIQGSALGSSCPNDTVNVGKKKLVISISGYSSDSDLTSSTGKLIVQSNQD